MHAKVAACAQYHEEGSVGFKGRGSQREKSERFSYGTIPFVSAQSTFSVESNFGAEGNETELLKNDLNHENTKQHHKVLYVITLWYICVLWYTHGCSYSNFHISLFVSCAITYVHILLFVTFFGLNKLLWQLPLRSVCKLCYIKWVFMKSAAS